MAELRRFGPSWREVHCSGAPERHETGESEMLAILPLLAFLGLFWLVRKRGHGWRYAFLVSAMLWTLYLIALTELLSSQSLISRPALALG